MKENKSRLPIMADAALMLIAAIVYITLVSPVSVMTMTGSTAHPIYRGREGKRIALQCAVSWNAAAMDEILDELDSRGVRITFAVSGRWAEENPGLLERMAESGHEIATMGYDPAFDGRRAEVLEDVERSLGIIEGITGKRPELYYCGSRMADVSAGAGKRLGLTTVLCTIDLDCANGTAFEIERRMSQNVKGGYIVAAEPTRQFAEALPFLIETTKNMGFDIAQTHKMLYNYSDLV